MSIGLVERCVTEPQRKGRGPRRQQADMAFPRVASALRELRQRADLTQEQFARLVGLTFAGYRPYERGERDLTYTQMEQFATALGVPVSEITRRLWPEDVQIVRTRFSHDLAELQRELEGLPPEIAEQVMRAWRDSVTVIHNASDLARRN